MGMGVRGGVRRETMERKLCVEGICGGEEW